MWFFHLADKYVSWNVSLFWTLSIFFLPLHSLPRGTKINPASYYCWLRWGKRVGGVTRCDCCRIVFGDLLWFWRCWRTSRLSGLGLWDDMFSHQWCTVFAHRWEEATQFFELPTSHNALCHDLMTSCDLSVLGEMIHKTDCSCFRDIACLKAQMPTTCLFKTSTFTFKHKVPDPEMHCSLNL